MGEIVYNVGGKLVGMSTVEGGLGTGRGSSGSVCVLGNGSSLLDGLDGSGFSSGSDGSSGGVEGRGLGSGREGDASADLLGGGAGALTGARVERALGSGGGGGGTREGGAGRCARHHAVRRASGRLLAACSRALGVSISRSCRARCCASPSSLSIGTKNEARYFTILFNLVRCLLHVRRSARCAKNSEQNKDL